MAALGLFNIFVASVLTWQLATYEWMRPWERVLCVLFIAGHVVSAAVNLA